jgi:hypothetical protein
MDAASVLILAVAAIVALTVFLLMRFPNLRRAQFRQYRAFSTRMAFVCATAVFGVIALLFFLQR